MKKFKNYLFLILPLIGLFSACNCDPNCPDCPTHKVCTDGSCELLDRCFELNKVGVCSDNLYLGVVEGSSCMDTIIFDATNSAHSSKSFPYYVKYGSLGLSHRTLNVTKELGENEYVMGDVSPICGSFIGVYWYFSYVHCRIYPDSVQMNIFFQATDRTLDDPFIDSSKVTLYKKAFLPD